MEDAGSRPLHPRPPSQPFRPLLTIRTEGDGFGCPESMVNTIEAAGDIWAFYSEGDFSPEFATSPTSGSIECRDNEGLAGHTALKCHSGEPITKQTCRLPDGRIVDAAVKMQFRIEGLDEDTLARYAVHELGHVYNFLGDVVFPEANGGIHTPTGVMSKTAASWKMPEVEHDE